MSTLTIGPGAASLGNGDRKAGVRCNFNASGNAVYYDTNTYNYSLSSITMNISLCKYYSVYGYFDVYNQAGTLLGRTKQWNVAENAGSVKASGASAISCTFTLINTNLVAAMQTSSFYLIIRRSSGSGNCCNIRSGCTGTLTINYTRTTKNSPPVHPTTIYYPATNGVKTYNTKPYFSSLTGTDPDGNNVQLGYAIYDTTTKTWPQATKWLDGWHSGGTRIYWSHQTALTVGHYYQLYTYARDTSYTVGTGSSGLRGFYVLDNGLSIGSVIDDATIDTLQTKINNVQAYYGQTKKTFTVCDNGTKLNRSQIVELENAIEGTPYVATTAYTSPAIGDKAIASQLSSINAIIGNA